MEPASEFVCGGLEGVGGGRSRFFNTLCKDDSAFVLQVPLWYQLAFHYINTTIVPWTLNTLLSCPGILLKSSSLLKEDGLAIVIQRRHDIVVLLYLYLWLETKHGCQMEVICPAAGTWSSVSDSEWRMLWRSPPSCSLLDTWSLVMVKNDDLNTLFEHGGRLQGLGHEMDWIFLDTAWVDLGLNMGRGRF